MTNAGWDNINHMRRGYCWGKCSDTVFPTQNLNAMLQDLERKAAELQRKEQELQRMQFGGKMITVSLCANTVQLQLSK